jgi:parallel beta-helix repeat protein
MSSGNRTSNIRKIAVGMTALACLSSWAFLLDDGTEKISAEAAASSPRIVVNGNADLISQAATNGWRGDGTPLNPYIIEGFTISPSGGQCIYISNTNLYLVITHCVLNDSVYGIYLWDVRNAVIENNTCFSSGEGIYAYGSDYLLIERNNFSYNGVYSDITVGILLLGCTDSTVYRNNVSGFGGGISVGSGSAVTVALNNVSTAYTGISASDQENGSITNNTLTDCSGDGIGLWRLSNFTVSGNCLTGRWGGIEIRDWNNELMIANNTLPSSYYNHGILLSNANNVTLRDNQMLDSGVVIEGNLVEQWTSHDIDSSNKINNSPVIYIKSVSNATVPGGAGQVILANCSAMIMENATISNGSVAVSLGFSDNCTVANCTLASQYDGIRMYRSRDNTVERNLLGVRGNSMVSLIESNMNAIANNTCISTQEWISQAISLSLSDSNLIKDNNCSGMASYSISIGWSEHNAIMRNSCFGASFAGIYLSSSENNSVEENLCGSTYQAGIFLTRSNNNSITGNTCINVTKVSSVSEGAGISLYLSDNNSLVGNDCQINPIGIGLESSNNTLMAENNCSDNLDHGILISKSLGCILRNNILTNNGIDLEAANESYWTANTIDDTNLVNGHPVVFLANQESQSVTGDLGEVILAKCASIEVCQVSLFGKGSTLVLAFTDLASISDSSFENCAQGIFAFRSNRNVIVNNTFLNCTGPAIYLHSGTGNLIFNNTFMDNCGVRNGVRGGNTQAWDNGEANWWNSTSYGNHWNDWTSPDRNHDGVVDSPYEIGGFAGSKDYYPYSSVKTNPSSGIVVASVAVLVIGAAIAAIIFLRRKPGKEKRTAEEDVHPGVEDTVRPRP